MVLKVKPSSEYLIINISALSTIVVQSRKIGLCVGNILASIHSMADLPVPMCPCTSTVVNIPIVAIRSAVSLMSK